MEQVSIQQNLNPLQQIFVKGFNARATGILANRDAANVRASLLYPVWELQRMYFMAGWEMANSRVLIKYN